MGKRWSINTRLWAYRYLVARDGEICQECGKSPTTQYSLDIDHKDGNKDNNDPSNLQLLCRKCNQAKENRRRSKCDHNVCVSVEGSPATRIVRDQVDYLQGSPEMKANSYFEIDFRVWLLKEIDKRKGLGVDRKEAINTGAELVGCSPMTTSRYLDKLLSKAGPLKEEKDLMGNKILVLKEAIQKAVSSSRKRKTTKPEKKATPDKEVGDNEG